MDKKIINLTPLDSLLEKGIVRNYRVTYSTCRDDGLVDLTMDEYQSLFWALQMPVYVMFDIPSEGWDKFSEIEKKLYLIISTIVLSSGTRELSIPMDIIDYHMTSFDYIDVDRPTILDKRWRIYRAPLPDFKEEFALIVRDHIEDLVCPISLDAVSSTLLREELDLISHASSVDDVASRIGISIDDAIDRMWEYAKKGFLILKLKLVLMVKVG